MAQSPPRAETPAPALRGRRAPPAVTVFVVVAGAVGLGALLAGALPISSIQLVFLVAVLLAAAAHGVVAGVAAALLASLAFNFFFIPPLYTFLIADPSEVFALGVFLVAAVVTGSVAGRMRQQADAARRRAALVQSLSDYSTRLAGCRGVEDALAACVEEIARALGAGAAALSPSGERVLHASPATMTLRHGDWLAAGIAARSGNIARRPAEPSDEQRCEFHPVRAAGRLVAVVGVERPPSGGEETEPALMGIVRQTESVLSRLAHEEAAARARGAAEEERLRNAVLSSVSHDLRTPLAVILGAATSLRELGPAMPPVARDDLLASIEDEAGRLSRLVASLLDMTRVEAGALVVRPDWVDLDDVLRAACERARRAHPGLRVETERRDAPALVRVDETLLGQTLFNLLDNAAIHGGGGVVRLRAWVEQDALLLAVSDDGPGVPSSEQAAIFEKFRRGTRETGRGEGTGLGLAVARGMVVATGGALTLRSPVADGRGACFEIRLPGAAVVPGGQE
ncbi:DUF4118 domain-containing protein [Alsobacter sp. SYSU M60028]|uniref:histidine kinase n=1 Tax=Alsobacter ponti TaxID=2962936 RepID=A0ABT1LC86_9HYPH|nr:DUF4118 domain-containing protein [Alsobacter ponti]MCP8939121.1 DUF4118 domain-containing protein [Alsobacter ponti]